MSRFPPPQTTPADLEAAEQEALPDLLRMKPATLAPIRLDSAGRHFCKIRCCNRAFARGGA